MSEESRLGHEAIETAYALKQIVQAGCRVFFYLEDRERTLDSPTDKIMLSLTAFADEFEREKPDSARTTRCTGRRKPVTSPEGSASVTPTWRSWGRKVRARTSSGASTRKRPVLTLRPEGA